MHAGAWARLHMLYQYGLYPDANRASSDEKGGRRMSLGARYCRHLFRGSVLGVAWWSGQTRSSPDCRPRVDPRNSSRDLGATGTGPRLIVLLGNANGRSWSQQA